MKRSSPPLQFLAAAADTNGPMSFRAKYSGGRYQGRRGFSDHRSEVPSNGQFIVGDSHFQSVREANRGFRAVEWGGYSRPNYCRQQPFSYPSTFDSHPPRGNRSQLHCNQQFRPRGSPSFNPRPQLRPRPPKKLDYRNWEYAKPGPPHECERFSILSYNILADYLAINHQRRLYFHIPFHILNWEFRKRSIIFELGLWSADILCFQEVDKFHELEEELKVRGYDGIWKMRTGDPVDGCATFWRVSRFKLVHEEDIEFNKLGLRDNVAQISVLELKSQKHDSCASASLDCSKSNNRVVACNIHVLYNSKRGEIKLGQVRVLLDRAFAVSKLWDDAPIVLCGDFNCTPKSSLYNFISEQKLDVSELPRDKISGQASAEIRQPRPFVPSVRRNDVPDVQKNTNAYDNSERIFSLMAQPQSFNPSSDGCKEETEPPPDFHGSGFSESSFGSHMEEISHNFVNKIEDDLTPAMNVSSSESSEHLESNKYEDYGRLATEKAMDNNSSTDALSQVTHANELEKVTTNHSSASLSDVLEVPKSETSGNLLSASSTYDKEPFTLSEGEEILEILSPNELGELGEDSSTFLSELHNTDAHVPSDFGECLDRKILDDSLAVNVEKPIYDPSSWTPMEIETATGSSEQTFMEHPIKLTSAYSEVEDYSGARDANGEPQVTSYHRGFLGTVDYIWRSDGLQTVKVLAPIPKHAIQWTPGFPTKKWGSDHIALVAELAFTNDHSEFRSRGMD